jgi:hypothetical protein
MRSLLPVLFLWGAFTADLTLASGIGCPKGASPNAQSTPELKEAWCERVQRGVEVQHGPYRAWWPNGNRANAGQYLNGQATGKWTAWFPSGRLQAEEWFENDVLVRAHYFDEQGRRVQAPVSSGPTT